MTWQKWGSKQALEKRKTSLSLMEVSNIALKCRVFRQTIPWPAMSLDMNPIEHVWDFIGRKINQRSPKCQNIDELRTAILREWQQFPQERLRRLVRSMTRIVTGLHNKLVIDFYALHISTDRYTPTPKSSCAQHEVVLK
jgi:hypothetical protein